VLNSITTYNVTLGRRFQTLFRDAARRDKGFARSMQNDGGNPQRKLDGDVTVRDVAEMEEEEVLGTEYNIAQETLLPHAAREEGSGVSQAGIGSCSPPCSRERLPATFRLRVLRRRLRCLRLPAPARARLPLRRWRPVALAYDGRQEEPRMQSVADSIRAFVLAAVRLSAKSSPCGRSIWC